MAKILVLNGPNLNLLGTREPDKYGHRTLAEIQAEITQLAGEEGHELLFFQSNAEHELIDRVQQAGAEGVEIAIINPAAYTHTSIALRDALLATRIPFIELHVSNVHAREPFRHRSYFTDIALGMICGLGPQGYELAVRAAMAQLQRR